MSLSDEAREEARRIIASALPLIEDLLGEGQTSFERLALDPLQPVTEEPAAPAEPVESQRLMSRTVEVEARAPAEPSLPSREATAKPAPLESRSVPQLGAHPSLDDVRLELGDCRRCQLCEGRNTIVFGDGNPQADLMFIGEGPGEHEDQQGLPFVGRAGELLTQMVEKGLGIARRDVYICNIVKCRPPNNRNPLPPEVLACRPFLDGQIDAIRPKVIVTLGKPAASLLLDRNVSILKTRGQWHEYRGIPLMPTLHPAYVLRQYTDEVRRNVWEDLKAALSRSQQD